MRTNDEARNEHAAFLQDYEVKDPIYALQMVCAESSLVDLRNEYFDLFTGAMYSNSNKDDTPDRKGDMMFLLNRTFRVIDAIYQIDVKVDQGVLEYSLNGVKVSRGN